MEIQFEVQGGNAGIPAEAMDQMQQMASQIQQLQFMGAPHHSPEEMEMWHRRHDHHHHHHCFRCHHGPFSRFLNRGEGEVTMYETMFGIGMLASAFMMLLVGCSVLGCRQLRNRRRNVTKTADDAEDRGMEAATLIMTEDDLAKKMPNPADDIAVVDAVPIVAVVVDSPVHPPMDGQPVKPM